MSHLTQTDAFINNIKETAHAHLKARKALIAVKNDLNIIAVAIDMFVCIAMKYDEYNQLFQRIQHTDYTCVNTFISIINAKSRTFAAFGINDSSDCNPCLALINDIPGKLLNLIRITFVEINMKLEVAQNYGDINGVLLKDHEEFKTFLFNVKVAMFGGLYKWDFIIYHLHYMLTRKSLWSVYIGHFLERPSGYHRCLVRPCRGCDSKIQIWNGLGWCGKCSSFGSKRRWKLMCIDIFGLKGLNATKVNLLAIVEAYRLIGPDNIIEYINCEDHTMDHIKGFLQQKDLKTQSIFDLDPNHIISMSVINYIKF